jgi:hypothetical protein
MPTSRILAMAVLAGVAALLDGGADYVRPAPQKIQVANGVYSTPP